MMRRLRAAAAGALLLSMAGCFPQYVVPEPLYRQVDQKVSFSQLRQDAGRYKGASVMLGGAVLNSKMLPEGTQIEVLQLQLDSSDRPTGAFEDSEGRFLLIDPQRIDPVVLQNRLITVVGEVVGAKVGKVDESEYGYPYLSARFIHVWRGASGYPAAAEPYYYPYQHPYSYPYTPYYPYYYGDLFFWTAPYYYYGSYGTSGGQGQHGPSQRRFEPPTGGGSPPPSPPPSSSGPGGGGGGGGGGRRFK